MSAVSPSSVSTGLTRTDRRRAVVPAPHVHHTGTPPPATPASPARPRRPAPAEGGPLDLFADAALSDSLLDPLATAAPPPVEPVACPTLPTIEAPKGGGGGGGTPEPSGGGGGSAGRSAAGPGGGDDAAATGGDSGNAAMMTGPPYPGGTPPTAVNDSAGVSYLRSVTINVRANDHPGAAYYSAVALVDGPQDAGATVSLYNGSFTYTAPQNWDLSDSFTYRYDSSAGPSNVATVSLYHVNGPPFGSPAVPTAYWPTPP